MVALLTAVHVLVALVLILAVLLQSARGTDIAGAFGGMGSQAAFGPRGTATFLSKATVVLAIVFMTTSISLAILANRSIGGGGESVLSGEEAAPTETSPPATPAEPGTPPVPRVNVTPAGGPPATNAPAATGETAPSAPAQPAEQPAAAPESSPPASPPAPNP